MGWSITKVISSIDAEDLKNYFAGLSMKHIDLGHNQVEIRFKLSMFQTVVDFHYPDITVYYCSSPSIKFVITNIEEKESLVTLTYNDLISMKVVQQEFYNYATITLELDTVETSIILDKWIFDYDGED